MIHINPGFFLNSSTKMWYSDGSSNVVGKKSHLQQIVFVLICVCVGLYEDDSSNVVGKTLHLQEIVCIYLCLCLFEIVFRWQLNHRLHLQKIVCVYLGVCLFVLVFEWQLERRRKEISSGPGGGLFLDNQTVASHDMKQLRSPPCNAEKCV